ncbi:SO2930 family diheme c-type cytochrome [Sphingobacterium sp. SYP-B4668]|uniref:SO2930 family diheme c-type cytochrome n=1 Tax=Sphingobacterium sp. SYP-B4668 TaxID=2996035 RepID=UPI0022DE1353|nr:SO2930 family diheme c-type cytochrome [Sphingobacterium sp. SYP-B4668]
MRKISLFGLLIILSTSSAVLMQQACKHKTKPQATTSTTGFEFKERLSDYGFFTGVIKDLTPAEGVVLYDLSTPLFTDYSIKDRFIKLPHGQSLTYTASGPLGFPDSSIIIKNFAYTNEAHQKIMIETRLLVKDPKDHKWKVMNYLWNKEQTDAVRHITGAKVPITLLDEDGKKHVTNYMVPNTNDCKRCHVNNGTLTPIGPKARNLNFTLNGQTKNQLSQLASNGILVGLPDLTKVSQLPIWTDSKHYSLEKRARAYLDINCAHCHTKGGDAFNTGLFLDYEENNANHLGIKKAPVSAGGGAGGLDFDIVPGDPAQSILLHRMNSIEPGTAMPELARTIIHKEGVALISEWIQRLPKEK